MELMFISELLYDVKSLFAVIAVVSALLLTIYLREKWITYRVYRLVEDSVCPKCGNDEFSCNHRLDDVTPNISTILYCNKCGELYPLDYLVNQDNPAQMLDKVRNIKIK